MKKEKSKGIKIKSLLIHIYNFLFLFGLDIRKTINAFRGFPYYFRNLRKIKKQKALSNIQFPFGRPYPCLEDRFLASGTAKGHYFHQDLLVARKVFLNNPMRHVDVGSSISGFVSHVASFRSIEVFDIRELPGTVPNVTFTQQDIMGAISDSLVNYCDSLSCLHALEHFGLGRYGDPVCYEGHLLGFNNFYKILKVGGKFYLGIPIGPQRIEFDGHRVFSMEYLLDLIKGKYTIDSFSYVNDKGNLIENAALIEDNIKNNFGCFYGCGIFEMTKIS